jgi:hypothetical protein
LTEHVSNGIISNKPTRASGRRVAAVTVAVCLALLWGCARRGSPVAGDGDGVSSGYRLVSTLAIEGYAEDIEVAGDLVLIAASQGGLVLVDVSDPASPAYLGMGPTGFSATGCAYAAEDMFGYVTDGSRGAVIYDVADPVAPAEVTYCEGTRTRDIVVDVVVPGQLHRVYGADGEGDLRIWKVEYFAQYHTWFGSQIGHASATGSARGICLLDTLALLAMEEIGLSIFDVSSPGSPVKIGHVDTPGEARAVAIGGSHAYVADWRQGLTVIDISDPRSPTLVGSAPTDGNAEGVFCRDGEVFVADHAGGLLVFDVSDPGSPTRSGYYETPFANAVWATDDYVFVADRDWGLVILEEDQ